MMSSSAASGREQSSSERGEDWCAFCRQREADPAVVGQTYSRDGLTVHQFCLYFSSGLAQAGGEDEGINGFLLPDIRTELKRGGKLNMRCVKCKTVGAYVGCSVKQCRRVGHLHCMRSAGFLFQYFGCFKAFCCKHRPTQPLPDPAPSPTSQQANCCVCLNPVECCPSAQSLYCPSCYTFFHHHCLQTQARTMGRYHFRCAVCGNRDEFVEEMLRMGIEIPQRDAEWELMGHFSGAYSVAPSCCAALCLCSEGRNYASGLGKFRMRKCESCGQCLGHVECTRDKGSHCVDCSILEPGGAGSSQEVREDTRPTSRGSRKRTVESAGNFPPRKKSRLSVSSMKSVDGPQVHKKCTCGICLAKQKSNWDSSSCVSSEDERDSSQRHCGAGPTPPPSPPTRQSRRRLRSIKKYFEKCPTLLLNPRVVLTRIRLSAWTKPKLEVGVCSAPTSNSQTVSLTEFSTCSSRQELTSSAATELFSETEQCTPAEVSIAIVVSTPADSTPADPPVENSTPAEVSIATAEHSAPVEDSTPAEVSIATAVSTPADPLVEDSTPADPPVEDSTPAEVSMATAVSTPADYSTPVEDSTTAEASMATAVSTPADYSTPVEDSTTAEATEVSIPAEHSTPVEVFAPVEDTTPAEVSIGAEVFIVMAVSAPAHPPVEDSTPAVSIATAVSAPAEVSADTIAAEVTIATTTNGFPEADSQCSHAREPTSDGIAVRDPETVDCRLPERLQNQNTTPCPKTMTIDPQLHGSSPERENIQVCPPERTAVEDCTCI